MVWYIFSFMVNTFSFREPEFYNQEQDQIRVRPHGRTFVRRCPRTKVRVRLTFTSYSFFCTMLNFFVQTVVHSTLLVSCTKISVRVTFL